MNHTKLLLGALAIGSIAIGCNNPPATDAGMPTGDAGRDGGGGTPDTGVDTGVLPSDGGTDAFNAADVGVPVTCAGYCAQIAISCTGTHVQYTDTPACMTACMNAGWTMGTQSDTAGNTLGCRVYHAIAAVGDATTHCPHAGVLGGGPNGPCAPWRTEPAHEGAPTATEGAYVRVDRMGMPAVATALIGPGTAPAGVAALKDTYNDSDPDGDAAFHGGTSLLAAIGAYHALLDTQLRSTTYNMTPCSVVNTFPAPVPGGGIPGCGAQDYSLSGTPPGPTPITATSTHTVASLIIPDTLRLDTSPADSHFPNGRNLQDDVINPTLAVLLLNLSPCAGSPTGSTCSGHTTAGMAACTADTNCTWVATGTAHCDAAAGTRQATCAATLPAACLPTIGCYPVGTSCVPVPCEALPTGACGTQMGCAAATCGTGTPAPACTVHSLDAAGLTPHTNDVTYPTPNPFPYFLVHH